MSGVFFNLFSHFSYFIKDFFFFILFYFIFSALLGIFLIFFIKRKKIKGRVFFINLIIFLFLIVNLFYGFELYYRYVFDQTDNVFQIKTMQRWKQRHVAINAFGFREDHFFDEKDSKEIRIAILGDSYSWGYGVENEQDRYGDLLEKTLNDKCQGGEKRFKVYTLALPGMSSKEELEIVKDYFAKYKIDVAILGYYLDDGGSAMTARHIQPCYNRIFSYRYVPIVRDFIENSFALEYFYVRFYSRFIFPQFAQECWTFGQLIRYQEPELWVRHLKQLQEIIDYTKENKVKLAVLMIPYLNFIGPDYPASQIHWRLNQFFEANKISHIDLLPSFSQYKPEELIASRYDFHASELAHSLIAKQLHEEISDWEIFNCR